MARTYLAQIQGRTAGYLKVVDSTGLGSFSFDELYAKIADNLLLQEGPTAVLRKQQAMHDLIDALRWLPELSLAIGKGPGEMDVSAVATVVREWIDGKPIAEIARAFPGDTELERTRSAGSYVYSKVSQTISWGAHAYLRGWLMKTNTRPEEVSASDKMLPAYIQHGVKTPEAAVASLMGVPRVVAESSGEVFRRRFGSIRPDNAVQMKHFLEGATETDWGTIAGGSRLSGRVTAADLRGVWREMQGLV